MKKRSMASPLVLSVFGLLAALRCSVAKSSDDFDQNYAITWGGDHVQYAGEGTEVQLSMDKASGSGFGSKLTYQSGLFHMNIKLPAKDTAGVVAAFYLSSDTSHHDELDFEFLGNREGEPITLQTNIFASGHGNREQRIHLWFDASEDFHDYKILWNPYHIIYFVDNIPIRIFDNQTNKGVDYPSQPMTIIASLWNGEDWATNGGKDKINWTQAPFIAHFQGFTIDGCTSSSSKNYFCSSPNLWWNSGKYVELSAIQISAYKHVKENYMTYDYCADKPRFHVPPPECSS